MNKKFFAALASATMAFTASGSIAVFADDFVEEKAPVLGGNDVKPVEKEVVWNEDNFGALVKESGTVFTGTELTGGLKAADGTTTLSAGVKVKTADLAKVEKITLTAATDDEIKGLEYFTGLKEFDDSEAKETNRALDFSANTKLEKLTLVKANGLATLVLPEASVDEEDKEEEYTLTTLNLQKTKLTTLDLTKYDQLEEVTVKENKTLRAITFAKGTTAKKSHKYNTFDLQGNSLEEIDLENCEFPNGLNLNNNRLGVIDLSKTTIPADKALSATGQVFYVSEDLATINVKDTFADVDTHDFAKSGNSKYEPKTGVLTLDDGVNTNGYIYTSKDYDDKARTLTVTIRKANPMNRLYNPNSGEHFYTSDIKEKEALVALGWQDEGFGWVAEKEGTGDKVYRLYNPNAGDHHYTTNPYERDTLVSYGWKDENVGWYSPTTGETVEVYRQYNPNANGAGSHNYTTDKAENDYLVSVGWVAEGTGWNGLR